MKKVSSLLDIIKSYYFAFSFIIFFGLGISAQLVFGIDADRPNAFLGGGDNPVINRIGSISIGAANPASWLSDNTSPGFRVSCINKWTSGRGVSGRGVESCLNVNGGAVFDALFVRQPAYLMGRVLLDTNSFTEFASDPDGLIVGDNGPGSNGVLVTGLGRFSGNDPAVRDASTLRYVCASGTGEFFACTQGPLDVEYEWIIEGCTLKCQDPFGNQAPDLSYCTETPPTHPPSCYAWTDIESESWGACIGVVNQYCSGTYYSSNAGSCSGTYNVGTSCSGTYNVGDSCNGGSYISNTWCGTNGQTYNSGGSCSGTYQYDTPRCEGSYNTDSSGSCSGNYVTGGSCSGNYSDGTSRCEPITYGVFADVNQASAACSPQGIKGCDSGYTCASGTCMIATSSECAAFDNNPPQCVTHYSSYSTRKCRSVNNEFSCGAFNSNQSSCQGTSGCTWNASYASCSSFNNNKSSCDGNAGCSWSYTAVSCNGLSQGSCTPSGCTWDSKTANCSGLSNQSSCQGTSGCTWNINWQNCSNFNTNQSSCQANCGAGAWNTQTTYCSSLNWSNCQGAGGVCTYDNGNRACSGFNTNQSSCQGSSGCSWDNGNRSCSSSFTNNQSGCQGTGGCSWAGTALNCSDFNNNQSGCQARTSNPNSCVWHPRVAGTQTRASRCIRGDGQIVDDSYCEAPEVASLIGPKPTASQAC